MILFSRNFAYAYAKFRECKTLWKISEFTVLNLLTVFNFGSKYSCMLKTEILQVKKFIQSVVYKNI